MTTAFVCCTDCAASSNFYTFFDGADAALHRLKADSVDLITHSFYLILVFPQKLDNALFSVHGNTVNSVCSPLEPEIYTEANLLYILYIAAVLDYQKSNHALH